VITKAAQIAVEEKGLLLVVSAGNEGQQAWRIVSAPADAAGVVSVGATNANGTKAGYSSVGPAALPYLKPDVSCHSLDGTSFSAPVVTGFAACLMQLRPDAKGSEIADALRQSAPLYPYGNHYIGYGIPQASRAINLLGGKKVSATMQEKKGRAKEKIQLKHPMGEGQALLFHKTDGRLVEKEQVVKASKGKIQVKRPKQATRTTVLFDNNTGVEIIWE
jgi:hypothetical protein